LTIKSTSHTTLVFATSFALTLLVFCNARQIFSCQRSRKLSAYSYQLSANTSPPRGGKLFADC
jgi:hypothetical protein